MKRIMLIVVMMFFGGVNSLLAHCEIPCGIYTDDMRIKMIIEDIATIEKSMKQINELSKDPQKNANQLVRWINNKEMHANKIQEVVTQYFMTQRITPVADSDSAAYKKYIKELTLLHKMLLSAMKTKQTADLHDAEKLLELTLEFSKSYLKK